MQLPQEHQNRSQLLDRSALLVLLKVLLFGIGMWIPYPLLVLADKVFEGFKKRQGSDKESLSWSCFRRVHRA